MTEEVGFAQILKDLSQKDSVDREFLHKIILSIPRVAEVVDELFAIISTTSNEARKIDIFNLVIDYLIEHKLDNSYDDAKICKLIENISIFPIISKATDFYAKLATVLQSLYDLLSQGTKETFVQVIPAVKAPYAPFVFSVFSVKNTLHLNQIIMNVSTTNVPLLEGIKLVLESHKVEDLAEEDKQLIKVNIIDSFIGSLLGAFNDVVKSYGVNLLAALLHYDSEAAETVLPSLDSLHSLLRKDTSVLRQAVLNLLTILPLDHKLLETEDQLKKTLTLACTVVKGPEDPIIADLIRLVNVRKDVESFPTTLQSILTADSTVVAGFIVALQLDLITPELLDVAFPATPKPIRVMTLLGLTKYLLSNDKCTDAIFCAILNQAINAYASADILKRADYKLEVLATIPQFFDIYSKFGASFSLTLLNRVTEISNLEVLETLAKESPKIKALKAPAVEDELFFKAFSYLFHTIVPIAQVQQVVSIFAQLSSSEEPKNPHALLVDCIPSAKLSSYITYAESCLKQMPRLAVLCVSVDGLDNAKLDELLKFIQQDDVYTLSLGVQFFSALGLHYFQYLLDTIEKEAYGKQVTGNIFVARKKRVRIADTVRAVLTVLPRALEGKDPLELETQKQLISILYNTIPHANIEDFTNELRGIRVVFTYLKEADPTEEQYTFFIESGFIREMPYLLRAVKGTPEISQSYMTKYADNIKLYHFDPKSINDVAHTLFRLSPTEDALFFAMELVRKRVKPKETALKFAVYAKCFAKAAHDNDVHITSARFAPFLVKFIIYTTCKGAEFREAAFQAFGSLFGLEDVPTDVGEGLTREQVNEQALKLFIEIAPKLSPEFINEFISIIHRKRFYTTATGIFIRAIFETRDDLGDIEVYGKIIMKLLNIQPQMPPLNRFHMEKGILAFAKRSMPTFLPLFLSSDSAYLNTLISRILVSPDHRTLFVEELAKLINTTKQVQTSLTLFENLKKIVITEETNELRVQSFASLTAEVLMWAATVYQLEPELNLIEINQHHNDMQEVFAFITSKTTVATKAEVTFVTTEPPTLNETIAQMAKNLIDVDVERLSALLGYLNLMIESPKQAFVLVAGLFLINFTACFSQYKNDQTEEFIENLYKSITKVFSTANLISRRCLALSLNRAFTISVASLDAENQNEKKNELALFENFEKEDVTSVYNCILDSIENNEIHVFEPDTIVCLCKLAPNVDPESLHPRRLFIIIKKGVDNYEFSLAYFVGLKAFLSAKNEIAPFIDQSTTATKLSLVGLFALIAKYEPYVLPILKQLSESEDIVSGLKDKVDASQLACCGLLGIYSAPSVSPAAYELLCGIAKATEESTEESVKEFREKFVLKSLPIAEDKTHPLNEKAVQTIKHLIK